ncbi:hypothetical protein TRFO_13748 [Tritrichomonas foetus]|uniref:non-specific serine/threonine protein kinase n=1 Tax=Tritrichomonas foetus TaxID=1144522 RepID=A0A1J4KX05_9EUKA|nr:hypothetical protein TRFO_13748 [Tritrichomonas foetus]|eukprot:OHT15767.1 hypothetical protein TRFO_13748 [Tritrichomonas foetus]
MQNFEIVKQLSTSTFKAIRIRDQKVFGLKSISYVGLSKAEKKRIVDTINTLIQLRCSNVIRYHNCVVDSDKGTLNLLTDFCEGGTLQDLLDQHYESRKPFDEEQIWSIATDIALALYECHNHKPQVITHGSLTADHIFIDSDDSAKIGCFSLNSCQSVDIEKDLTDLGKLIFEMATLSKAEVCHHSYLYKLKNSGEGIREVATKLLSPSSPKFNLVNFLEFPEVALKVLEKKLKIEKSFYEQEKAKYLALEESISKREKNVNAAGYNLPQVKA